MKKQRLFVVSLALGLLLLLATGLGQAQGPAPEGVQPDAAVGTGFTYQGRLRDGGGSPIHSTCDFTFSLWDAESVGTQVGGDSLVSGVSVVDGYFAALVNSGGEFGGSAFSGDARWLQIAVQCTGDPGYTALSPRQPLTAAPYARYSLGAPWSGLSGVPDLQLRVSGTCATGNAIRVVNADGSVTCEPVGGGGAHDHWGETWSGSGTGLILTGGAMGLSGNGMGFGLYGESDTTIGTGVAGWATADSGETRGVAGQADSSEGGIGVHGRASAATGWNYGVYGEAESTDGRGVYGRATATSGAAYGVFGWTDSPDGYAMYGQSNQTAGGGVHGYAGSLSGYTYGVWGESFSSDGRGVFGYASAGSGENYGVYGQSNSPDGRGVYGYANAASGTTFGVRGTSTSPEGLGVAGYATAASDVNYGVYGRSVSPDGRGVAGLAAATSGTNYGVRGVTQSPDGTGVYGWASATGAGMGASEGVYGRSDGPDGRGVHGSAAHASGTNYGVYGVTQSPNGYGVYYVGGLGGTGLKTSVVETQDYGWRHLYTVESPGNWFEDFGTAQLVDGQAVVPIEPVFAQTVNLAEPYQVLLTPVSDEPVLLFVSAQTSGSFTVQGVTLAGQPAACSFHYRVVARRLGYEDVRLGVASPPPATEVESGGGGR